MRVASGIGSRWYFGWNIVAAAAVLTLLSTGMRLGMGPYFMPMAHELGFSRTLLAAIMDTGMQCYGLAMPVVGLLVARHGTRRVLLIGAGIVLASAIWTLFARQPVSFLLSFGVCFSVGLAFTSPVALTGVISHWFTRRRAMALFLLATGSMAGIALVTPLTSLAIAQFGWRASLLGFAVLLAACTVPAALFVIREVPPVSTDLLPEEAAAERAHVEATEPQALEPVQSLRTAAFWRIFFGLFCCGFSMNLLGTHGVPMLMDRGFDAVTGGMAMGTLGLAAVVGTVLMGSVAGRVRQHNMLAFVYAVRGLGFFTLLVAASVPELYATAVLLGLVWAGGAALSSSILADLYGVRLVGLLYGTAYFGHQLGATASSFLGGWAYESFGSHWIAFGTAGGLLLTAAVLALQLPQGGAPAMPPQPVPAR
jgi:MFS family permease